MFFTESTLCGCSALCFRWQFSQRYCFSSRQKYGDISSDLSESPVADIVDFLSLIEPSCLASWQIVEARVATFLDTFESNTMHRHILLYLACSIFSYCSIVGIMTGSKRGEFLAAVLATGGTCFFTFVEAKRSILKHLETVG